MVTGSHGHMGWKRRRAKIEVKYKKMSTAKVFFLIQYFYKNQTLAILFTSVFQNIKNPLSVVIFGENHPNFNTQYWSFTTEGLTPEKRCRIDDYLPLVGYYLKLFWSSCRGYPDPGLRPRPWWRLPQSEQLQLPGHKGREMNDENSRNPVSEKIEKGQIITMSVQGQKIWRPVQISIRYKGSQLQGTLIL